jgi:hypothetical protein
MRHHAHRADGQPVSLERARSRRQRLDRLAAVVERVVGVQAGLVEAVDRLERRTGPEDRRVQPEPAMTASPAAQRRPLRRGVRLAIQILGVLLAGLAVAVVFSAGPGLHPGMGMPPALADPTTTREILKAPTTTTGRAGGGSGGSPTSTGGARQGRVPTRPAMAVPAEPTASSTTTLPVVSSTTAPAPETSMTVPEIPTTTLCRNPKHCDDG